MKRAWFQRIRGGGMSNLGYGGKNPCFITLLICHLFVSPNLVNLFNASELVVEEIWLSGWGQLLPLGVGWQGCQLHTHIHTPPTSAHSSPSRTLPWSVYTLTTILVCWLLTHRLWAILVSRRHFLGLHELLKHPRTVIRVLANVLFLHEQNRSCFLLTPGLYGCASSRRGISSHFPSSRLVFCWIYPRSISLGELWIGWPYPSLTG